MFTIFKLNIELEEEAVNFVLLYFQKNHRFISICRIEQKFMFFNVLLHTDGATCDFIYNLFDLLR